ncbi:hypothetical protein PENSPDRAFT_672688 [Peniophora sp. CONT]|nr:hypothetical protein PENSPDRAFT_672688 [Peniophora sp. CONT]
MAELWSKILLPGERSALNCVNIQSAVLYGEVVGYESTLVFLDYVDKGRYPHNVDIPRRTVLCSLRPGAVALTGLNISIEAVAPGESFVVQTMGSNTVLLSGFLIQPITEDECLSSELPATDDANLSPSARLTTPDVFIHSSEEISVDAHKRPDFPKGMTIKDNAPGTGYIAEYGHSVSLHIAGFSKCKDSLDDRKSPFMSTVGGQPVWDQQW